MIIYSCVSSESADTAEEGKAKMSEWLKVTDADTASNFKKHVNWKATLDNNMLGGKILLKDSGVHELLWDKYTDEIFILPPETKTA